MGTKRQDLRRVVALWRSWDEQWPKWPTLLHRNPVFARHVRSIPLNWQRPTDGWCWYMLNIVELCWYVWSCLIVFAAFTLKLWRCRVWAAFCWPSHPCSCMACRVTAWISLAGSCRCSISSLQAESWGGRCETFKQMSREVERWDHDPMETYGDLSREDSAL